MRGITHSPEMVNSGKLVRGGHLQVCPMGSARWGDVGDPSGGCGARVSPHPVLGVTVGEHGH